MKAAASGKSGAGQGAGRSWVWLQGLACGAVATLATPLAVLLGVLLLPGLVVLLLDRVPGKPVARIMLTCGAAASIWPAWHLWAQGMTMPGALDLLADASALGLAWAATAAGWVLAELMPVLVLLVLEGTSRRRDAELRAARARLEAEWGIAPQTGEISDAGE
jgi:hypothetical protein